MCMDDGRILELVRQLEGRSATRAEPGRSDWEIRADIADLVHVLKRRAGALPENTEDAIAEKGYLKLLVQLRHVRGCCDVAIAAVEAAMQIP